MWQKTIKLPREFVFKSSSLKTVISVLVRLSNLRRKEIHVDFSRIKQVRKGDLMVLMAQLEKLATKRKQIKFKNIPNSVRNLLSEKVVHFTTNTNILNNAKFAKKANPTIVENLVRGLKKIGINRNSVSGFTFYERVEALLSEIMGNAVEHGIRNRNINYWLTSEIDSNKQMVVTFVDMGKGIAYSHKKSKLLLKYRMAGWFSDNKIVMDSLLGKLPSSTQKPNRGKGLPEIRETIIERSIVSDFILITNRTLIQYKDNKFTSTKVANFKGTYYCWTISKNNFEKWKTLSQ
jgi:hypothetical protein